MSMLGIDTSQLISRFTTETSQNEWADVEAALQKAFPGKSMEQIHASATVYAAGHPDATIDDMVQALSQEFAVSISTELATEIRNEWDEFSSASDLTPAELLAVLDDYTGDKVDTNSRTYLMFLMQSLQKEIEKLTTDTATTGSEVDRARYEAQKEELNKKIEESNKPASFWDTFTKWAGAVAAVIGAVIAVAVAVAISVGTGGAAAGFAIAAAAIACTLAVSAVVGAATDGEYSIAGCAAKILEACGVDAQTAAWIGMGLEIALAVAGIVCSLGAGLAGSAGTAASTGTNVASTASTTASTGANVAKTATTAASTMEKIAKVMSFANGLLMATTGVVQGAKAVIDYEYAMEQADIAELKALLEKLLQILKAGQQINEALLQAIFDALRGIVTGDQKQYLDVLMKSANVDMA